MQALLFLLTKRQHHQCCWDTESQCITVLSKTFHIPWKRSQKEKHLLTVRLMLPGPFIAFPEISHFPGFKSPLLVLDTMNWISWKLLPSLDEDNSEAGLVSAHKSSWWGDVDENGWWGGKGQTNRWKEVIRTVTGGFLHLKVHITHFCQMSMNYTSCSSKKSFHSEQKSHSFPICFTSHPGCN